MVYLDTSVVLPLFLPQPESLAVEAWFNGLPEIPVSSDWMLTEFFSAVSIKVRQGALRETHARAVAKAFDEFAGAGVRLLPVSRAAFAAAGRLVRDHKHGLRAGDALHLAVAKEIGATGIGTFDSTMQGNARRIGLSVVEIEG